MIESSFSIIETLSQEVNPLVNEWRNHTSVHPVGLAILLFLCALTILLPKKNALFPLIALACFIPAAQRIVVFQLDFTFLRIMVLAGWIRLILRQELTMFRWNSLDTAIVVWGVTGTIVKTLQIGDADALVYMLGSRFDALGMYFLFRILLREIKQIDRTILVFILISIPVAIFFVVEKSTRHNIFSVFGGVPEITKIRRGRLRCQGAFAHPILAGCFWASLVPFFMAFYYRSKSSRLFSLVGIFSTLVIVACCSSSTPISGLIFSIAGFLIIPLRYHLSWFRWITVMVLFSLHFLMKHPVWHLLARVDLVGGSTGWHRYILIDQAINYFPDWWLVGKEDTTYWGYGLFDVTNQYVLEGVEGGVWTLIAFIVLIVIAFRNLGYVWRFFEKNTYYFLLAWGTGVALFVHNMNFIGVSYFGQIILVWYMQLAIVANLYSLYLERKERQHSYELPPISLPMREAHP